MVTCDPVFLSGVCVYSIKQSNKTLYPSLSLRSRSFVFGTLLDAWKVTKINCRNLRNHHPLLLQEFLIRSEMSTRMCCVHQTSLVPTYRNRICLEGCSSRVNDLREFLWSVQGISREQRQIFEPYYTISLSPRSRSYELSCANPAELGSNMVSDIIVCHLKQQLPDDSVTDLLI